MWMCGLHNSAKCQWIPLSENDKSHIIIIFFFLSPSFSTYKSFKKNEWTWFGMAPIAQGKGLVRYKNFAGSGETTSQVISFPLFQGEIYSTF